MAKTLDFFAIAQVKPKSYATKAMMDQYLLSIKQHGLFAPETNALRQALGQSISEATIWAKNA